MIEIMHIRTFTPMDRIEPNMAAVTTPKHGKRIIILMGTDPRRPTYLLATDKGGTVYHIRKSDLYILLTGRKP